MIRLASLAGGAVGLGIAYLVDPEVGNGSLYLTLATAGAATGLTATYRAYVREGAPYRDGSRTNLEVELLPAGLLGARVPPHRSGFFPPPSPPLLRVNWRFP